MAAQGGIRSSGQLEGFEEIDYAGHDIAQALDGAELIFAVSPAFATEPTAAVAQPHLRPGQNIVVCPSSCAGSLVFKDDAGPERSTTTPTTSARPARCPTPCA